MTEFEKNLVKVNEDLSKAGLSVNDLPVFNPYDYIKSDLPYGDIIDSFIKEVINYKPEVQAEIIRRIVNHLNGEHTNNMINLENEMEVRRNQLSAFKTVIDDIWE